MGRRHLCTNQSQRSGGPKCPNVASASLTHASHSAAAGWRVGTCWLLLAAVVSVLWRAISQGLPAQIHFWAVRDGSDGVPRRANLAEPVPWPQVSSWPLMSPLGSFPLPVRLSLPHGAHPSCRLPGVGRDQRCSVSRAHPCLPSPMGTRALSLSLCACVWRDWVGLAI